MKKMAFFAIILFIALNGCGGAFESESAGSQEGPISVSEFSSNADRYDQKLVTIRGFLNANGPGLFLSEDDKGAPKRGDPIVHILDPELHFTMGNEGYTVDGVKREIKCTGNYADVTAVAGFIREYQLVGLVQITQISIYESNSFTGDGDICFSGS